MKTKSKFSNVAGQLNMPDATSQVGSSGREIDFLKLALRYKWPLLAGLLCGIILGEAGYRHLGPYYEGTSRILVSKKVEAPIKDSAARTFGERAEHVALIMSPMIVGKAIESHKLDELPSLVGEPDPAEEILDSLKVLRSAGDDRSFLNILDIKYISAIRDDAGKVVTAIIDAYGKYLAETQQEHTTEAVRLITEANADLEKQLQAKSEEYVAFRERSPLLWKSAPGARGGGAEVTNVHRERFLAIEADRRKNLLRQAEIQSRISALLEAKSNGESEDILEEMVRVFLALESSAAAATGLTTSPEQAALDGQLVPLLLQEKTLERDFGTDHPELQSVQERIQTLLAFYRQKGIRLPQDALNAGGKRIDLVAIYVRSLRQLLTELGHREIALKKLYDQEEKLTKQFSRYLLEDQVLNEGIQRVKKLWQTVVNRLNQLNLTKDTSGYRLKRIAPVRSELVIKRHVKFLLGGAVFGMLVVLGGAYVTTSLDTTIKTIDDIQNHLNLPILGAIPEFSPVQPQEIAASPHAQQDTSLVYLHRPGSSAAEAYRSVRTALFVSAQSDQSRVIQISSPLPGDGKTTFASNLAIAISQAGKSVLLIDADMRRPSVDTLFGARGEIGLSEVLTGEIEFANVVQPTAIEKLSIISAGALPDHPAELLSSLNFRQLLETAKRDFDFVLVDTPPLLLVSDPCIVAPQTDGLMLVLRMRSSTRAGILRVAELMETHTVSVIGTVANGLGGRTEETYGNAYTTEQAEYPNRSTQKHPISAT